MVKRNKAFANLSRLLRGAVELFGNHHPIDKYDKKGINGHSFAACPKL